MHACMYVCMFDCNVMWCDISDVVIYTYIYIYVYTHVMRFMYVM